jgi:hypothetical protein
MGYLDYINKKHIRERRVQAIRNKISGFVMLTVVFLLILTLALIMAFCLTKALTKIIKKNAYKTTYRTVNGRYSSLILRNTNGTISSSSSSISSSNSYYSNSQVNTNPAKNSILPSTLNVADEPVDEHSGSLNLIKTNDSSNNSIVLSSVAKNENQPIVNKYELKQANFLGELYSTVPINTTSSLNNNEFISNITSTTPLNLPNDSKILFSSSIKSEIELFYKRLTEFASKYEDAEKLRQQAEFEGNLKKKMLDLLASEFHLDLGVDQEKEDSSRYFRLIDEIS